MERLPSENAKEQFPGAAKLIGHALKFSPQEMIDLVYQWKVTTGIDISTSEIVTDIVFKSLYPEEDTNAKQSKSFLLVGLEDISSILNTIGGQYPELDDEALLGIMSDDDTIRTVAFLALRSEKYLRNYTHSALQDTGSLSPEGTAYTIEDAFLQIESRGCPAAGFVSAYPSDGEVSPLPLFTKFIPWAAQIHLLSDERHPFRERFEPLMLEK